MAIRLSHKCSQAEDGAGPQGFLRDTWGFAQHSTDLSPEATRLSDTLSLGLMRDSKFLSGF